MMKKLDAYPLIKEQNPVTMLLPVVKANKTFTYYFMEDIHSFFHHNRLLRNIHAIFRKKLYQFTLKCAPQLSYLICVLFIYFFPWAFLCLKLQNFQ